jgi:predicted RNA-binding protein with PIN domain
MALLIDGYNLLHATGLLGTRHGPGVLEKARLALLNLLAESLDPAELPRTIVVFDARQAPWGVPHSMEHKGLHVRFAAEHAEADELIEELIRADSAPRSLTVVSGDHRLQTAARRRRAKAVASEQWLETLMRLRRQRRAALPESPAESKNALTETEVNYWLHQFDQPVLDEAERLIERMNEDRPLPQAGPPKKPVPKRKR